MISFLSFVNWGFFFGRDMGDWLVLSTSWQFFVCSCLLRFSWRGFALRFSFSLWYFKKRQEFFFSHLIFPFFFHIYLFAFYHDINGDHIHTVRQAREGKDGRVLGRVCSLHLVILFSISFNSSPFLYHHEPFFFLTACALLGGWGYKFFVVIFILSIVTQ